MTRQDPGWLCGGLFHKGSWLSPLVALKLVFLGSPLQEPGLPGLDWFTDLSLAKISSLAFTGCAVK